MYELVTPLLVHIHLPTISNIPNHVLFKIVSSVLFGIGIHNKRKLIYNP